MCQNMLILHLLGIDSIGSFDLNLFAFGMLSSISELFSIFGTVAYGYYKYMRFLFVSVAVWLLWAWKDF